MPDDNAFWLYANQIYNQSNNQEKLLKLQDNYDVDINFLLFMAWLGKQKKQISAKALESLLAQSAFWQDELLKPLRNIRRALKSGDAQLYQQAKNFELSIEKQYMQQLQKQSESLFFTDSQGFCGKENVNYYFKYKQIELNCAQIQLGLDFF